MTLTFDPSSNEWLAEPRIVSGPRTVKCECGWEKNFILPEDSDPMLLTIFNHIQQDHSIKLPVLTFTNL
jgi:hypothetical protein